MTFDKAWLEPNNLARFFKKDVFFIEQDGISDSISLRIRSEIITLLNRPITSNIKKATIVVSIHKNLFTSDEAYQIRVLDKVTIIKGNTPIAALYGFYGLIRNRLHGHTNSDYFSTPNQSFRMINHWDQIDGTVERGYAGASIFFGDYYEASNIDRGNFAVCETTGDPFRRDYQRIIWYARLLASIGINTISINNVNVRGQATRLITMPLLQGVADLARIFSSFGIKIFMAINWESPKKIGKLQTSNPLNENVIDFWRQICKKIYNSIPDFGGFIVKADSEGEPGPYQYGCTHADGANMLARVLKPYNGIVIWRTFVYNSRQDWRDRTTDRAKAAYDNFIPLDGKFDDNVILQIKFGPIDFQTIEPLSPLFGALRHTNQMMEFEITSEYLGHQIDINYALPQWLRIIHFNTGYQNGSSALAGELIKENSTCPQNSGFVGVSNVGMDENWTGNKLAQANLYGFGRMCWQKNISAETILQEWIDQTFPFVPNPVKKTLFNIMITSNKTFRDYTAPLGVGFMVVPHYHYGPAVNGYEYDRWGTYHFADRNGVGVDRTQATGTGYTSLYSPKVATMYEHLETTPDELILFFHHVPYSHILHNGKTVIQTIYDTHFEGYSRVEKYIDEWSKIKGQIDEETYQNVAKRLQLQKKNAAEWRDQINTYFYRMSGVKDALKRKIYN